MFWKNNQKRTARTIIAEERWMLVEGVDLACTQWKYGNIQDGGDVQKYNIQELLERRYMYLLGVAKKIF